MKRGDALGPNDAFVVMARLNDGPNKPADANTMAAHMHGHLFTVCILNRCAHCFGIFCAKVKDLPHFNSARHFAALLRHLCEKRLIVGLIGTSVFGGKLFHDRLTLRFVIIIDVTITKRQIGHRAVVEHFTLACLGQNQKFMGIIATDRATVGAHGNSLQAHALISAQIAHQMAIIGVHRIFFGQIKIIAVFHIELAAPHHTKPWTPLIAELPLDLIHGQGHILVRRHMTPKNICDQLFCGGGEKHIAAVAVFNAQHLLTIIIIAP